MHTMIRSRFRGVRERSRSLGRSLSTFGGYAAVVLLVLTVSCGLSNDDGSTASATTSSTPSTTEPALELPARVPDLVQLCETGVGFADLPDYDDASPGPHLIHIELENQGGSYSSPRIAPREWEVTGSQIRSASLVACGSVVERIPTAEFCEFETADGAALRLELVDVVYDIEILSAATGQSVGSIEVVGTSAECPASLNNHEPGETEYWNTLLLAFDDGSLIDGIAPFVTP